jgi:hypothetical protein
LKPPGGWDVTVVWALYPFGGAEYNAKKKKTTQAV